MPIRFFICKAEISKNKEAMKNYWLKTDFMPRCTTRNLKNYQNKAKTNHPFISDDCSFLLKNRLLVATLVCDHLCLFIISDCDRAIGIFAVFSLIPCGCRSWRHTIFFSFPAGNSIWWAN